MLNCFIIGIRTQIIPMSMGNQSLLKLKGEGATFQSLVKRAAGDIPIGAMKTELKRIGAITENSEGLLEVNTRQHLPRDVHDRLLNGIEFGLRTLAATVDFNGNPNNENLKPQKFIHSSDIDIEKLPLLQKFLKEKIESFSVETDDLICRRLKFLQIRKVKKSRAPLLE